MSDIVRSAATAALLALAALAPPPLAAQGVAPPAADPYASLPPAIRQEVTRRGCRPPIRSDADSSTVVVGSLYGAAGTHDVAVLCVRGDSGEDARVLAFRAGWSVRSPAVLDFRATPSRVPADDGETRLCEGGLSLVRAEDLRELVRDGQLADADDGRLSAAERAAPVHDGVLDGDCEGVSVVHYWTGRRWVLLPGGD